MLRRSVIGLLAEAEKITGAVAAVDGMKKLDPNAYIFTEAAAAVAGFEGAGANRRSVAAVRGHT
jgi:hypothetical protein